MPTPTSLPTHTIPSPSAEQHVIVELDSSESDHLVTYLRDNSLMIFFFFSVVIFFQVLDLLIKATSHKKDDSG